MVVELYKDSPVSGGKRVESCWELKALASL